MKNIISILALFISTICYSQQRLDVITVDNSGATKDSCVQKFTDDASTAYIYFRNDTLWSKAKDSIRCISCRISIGGHYLTAQTATTCTTANTYYKIGGTWADQIGNNFVTDGANKLTFSGFSKTKCIGIGTSEVSSDKAANVTYAIYYNGQLSPTMTTTHDLSTNKIESYNINRPFIASKGDYFEVWVKSSVDNTVVTSYTLQLSVIGDR